MKSFLSGFYFKTMNDAALTPSNLAVLSQAALAQSAGCCLPGKIIVGFETQHLRMMKKEQSNYRWLSISDCLHYFPR
jgi:hypothetical protein